MCGANPSCRDKGAREGGPLAVVRVGSKPSGSCSERCDPSRSNGVGMGENSSATTPMSTSKRSGTALCLGFTRPCLPCLTLGQHQSHRQPFVDKRQWSSCLGTTLRSQLQDLGLVSARRDFCSCTRSTPDPPPILPATTRSDQPARCRQYHSAYVSGACASLPA